MPGNVLGFSPFSPVFYEKIIVCCRFALVSLETVMLLAFASSFLQLIVFTKWQFHDFCWGFFLSIQPHVADPVFRSAVIYVSFHCRACVPLPWNGRERGSSRSAPEAMLHYELVAAKRPCGFDSNHGSESLRAAESYPRFRRCCCSHLLLKIQPICFFQRQKKSF